MRKQFNLFGIVAVLAIIFIIAGCEKNAKNPVSISDIEQQIKALNAESGAIECVPTGMCASSVYDYSQGTLKNGSAVSSDRSDPNKALGSAVDNVFFSLGFNKNDDGTFQEEGGYIVVKFDDKYAGTALTVWEETHGSYPVEKADVYISKNGTDWDLVGTATNTNGSAYTRPTNFDIEGKCFQYVKIVDKTDPALHAANADAFDVNAVCIENAEKCQVCEPLTTDLIAGQHTDVGSVTVWNSPDGTTLYVQYIVESPWYLTEAHVWVGTDYTKIPKNAAPGQFPYKEEFEEPYPTAHTFSIPKEEGWDCGTDLLLAAHAKVCKPGEGEPTTQFVQGVLATQTLWAGQNIDAGIVTVKVESENLVVTYETKDGWEMDQTHLYVGKTNPQDLTAAPGQFPYKNDHDPAVAQFTYVIPLASIDSYHMDAGKMVANGDPGIICKDLLYVAAHAAVHNEVLGKNETAWGDGDQIDGGWAMYFSVTVECETSYSEPECETAWGFGPYTFKEKGISKKWGWFFDYTVCCE